LERLSEKEESYPGLVHLQDRFRRKEKRGGDVVKWVREARSSSEPRAQHKERRENRRRPVLVLETALTRGLGCHKRNPVPSYNGPRKDQHQRKKKGGGREIMVSSRVLRERMETIED